MARQARAGGIPLDQIFSGGAVPYYVYEADTGRIVSTGTRSPDQLHMISFDRETQRSAAGHADMDREYVADGQLVERPAVQISGFIDGRGLHLSPLPAGSTVWVSGAPSVGLQVAIQREEPITIQIDAEEIPKRLRVTVNPPFPYQEAEAVVAREKGAEAWQSLKAEALRRLAKTDEWANRTWRRGRDWPEEWEAYADALREIVRQAEGVLAAGGKESTDGVSWPEEPAERPWKDAAAA